MGFYKTPTGWLNRETKMRKTKTIDIKGKEYSQVKERLKVFREQCPYGLIETKPEVSGDKMIFYTRILKDKRDKNSAEATGHSMGDLKANKDFEKLETISVGRALALLGYAQDGEIASSEEMEEFNKYKEEKFQKEIQESKTKLENCKSLKELQEVWLSLNVNLQKELKEIKEQLKLKLK